MPDTPSKSEASVAAAPAAKKNPSFFRRMRVKARAGLRGGKKLMPKISPRGLSMLKGAAAPFGLNLAGVALEYAPDIVRAVKQDFGSSSEDPLDKMLRQDREIRNADRLRKLQRQKIEKLTAANVQRLTTTMPHLAASIMAGREIPEDGVVIGGRPRQDLLEQVAQQMAAGAFESEE